ncbi:sensor histidine kinase [Chitinophaga barathri]|uniref:Histidine kinase n=1 Tax=Chitinophaga barathri TaxID=1647451 RepID=A0A3N4MW69_9BACT|nr:histidine kinase [Chitinophaga barathri]RPD39643.1 histidine kinase [Chitinophaga barathri]
MKNVAPRQVWLQIGIWTLFYAFMIAYSIYKWDGEWIPAILSVTISVACYALIVYGNSHWLYPRYSGRRYVLYSFLFFTAMLALRMGLERLFLGGINVFYTWTAGHFTFSGITLVIAFFFGSLYRIALDYVQLRRHQEALRHQHRTAELNLLKAQVQPHFLFNSLNNIYYLAYIKSDLTPGLIARLAELMRYFVEEAPKEKVLLQTEIDFLNNYIELERIRMRHQIDIRFEQCEIPGDLSVPPMLFIPLVENVFKHGIDQLRTDNEASLRLEIQDGVLSFRVRNKLAAAPVLNGGNGLQNLRKRLRYLDGIQLTAARENGYYHAGIDIPLKY